MPKLDTFNSKHAKLSGSKDIRLTHIALCLFGIIITLYIWIIFKFGIVTSPWNKTNESKGKIPSKYFYVTQPSHIDNGFDSIRNVMSYGSDRNDTTGSSIQANSAYKHGDLNKSESDNLSDAVTAVVQCSTTKGNLTVDVRGHWAPVGSQQFLKLVTKGLFTDLPFFRVCPRYISQFGAKYGWHESVGGIFDDPSLWGKRDMNFGYLFFAGSGEHSRCSQMVVALCAKEGCRTTGLGRASWEVPVATIRRDGFDVLVNIERSGFPYPRLEMHGQHPNASGPNQARINREKDYLGNYYPYMEYWKECHIVAKDIEQNRPLYYDHHEELSVVELSNDRVLLPHNSRALDGPIYVQLLIVVNGDNDGGPNVNLAESVIIEVLPEWAPMGAQRFIDLVDSLFYDDARFFRVIKGFMAQFGIASTPERSTFWRQKPIPDDPVTGTNVRGTVSFAMAGPNTRTSQIFINYGDNSRLDREGFAPFGRVIEGMEVVDRLFHRYGEGGRGDGSDGKGPAQGRINRSGQQYLDKYFPKLSYIRFAKVMEGYTFHNIP